MPHPSFEFSEELPINRLREPLIQMIQKNSVVIVQGQPGSGKSTQLPKLLLSLGLDRVAHTQPRRLAAKRLALRIQEEVPPHLKEKIGLQTRFEKQLPPSWVYKSMTEGILVQEAQASPLLHRYRSILLDEVHERSLNMDLLMGWIKEILPKRRDLKLIISSATMDAERLADYFKAPPPLYIPEERYPIETRYRPPAPETQRAPLQNRPLAALSEAIASAIEELDQTASGDILVFLSGEAEISLLSEELTTRFPYSEVLPLYARLGREAQQRVFAPGSARRIILSTNIAETSVTLPRVRHVIDAGTARVARYAPRTGQMLLKPEPISRASSDQRRGRCGRCGPGICIRLYEETDYLSRPAFSDPELLRIPLTTLCLKLLCLGGSSPETFPFLDPPQMKRIKEAMKTLVELGAVQEGEGARRLTALGVEMSRLPLDAPAARVLLESKRSGIGQETAILLAVMAMEDPLEQPMEFREAARKKQQRFKHGRSDLLGYLQLWRVHQDWREKLSRKAWRTQCQAYFIHPQKLIEWEQIAQDLCSLAKIPWDPGRLLPPDRFPIDRLLALLLQAFPKSLAQYKQNTGLYHSAHGGSFSIHPSSGLHRSKSPWILAGQRLETQKAWGKYISSLPETLITLSLPKQIQWKEGPISWNEQKGEAYISYKGLLFGLPLLKQKSLPYKGVHRAEAQRWFIEQELLAEEGPRNRWPFLMANEAFQKKLASLEQRSGLALQLTRDQWYEWYAKKLPLEVASRAELLGMLRKSPDLGLDLQLDHDPEWKRYLSETEKKLLQDYPERWSFEGYSFPIHYGSAPPGGAPQGAAVVLPLYFSHPCLGTALSWGLPSQREALLLHLVQTLPLKERERLGRWKLWIQRFLERYGDEEPPVKNLSITESFEAMLEEAGVQGSSLSWNWSSVPSALLLRYLWENTQGIYEQEEAESWETLLPERPKNSSKIDRPAPKPSWNESLREEQLHWGEPTKRPEPAYQAAPLPSFPFFRQEGHRIQPHWAWSEAESFAENRRFLSQAFWWTQRKKAKRLWKSWEEGSKAKLTQFHFPFPLEAWAERLAYSMMEIMVETDEETRKTLLLPLTAPLINQQIKHLGSSFESLFPTTLQSILKALPAFLSLQRKREALYALGPQGVEVGDQIETWLNQRLHAHQGFCGLPPELYPSLHLYLQGLEARLKQSLHNPSKESDFEGLIQKTFSLYRKAEAKVMRPFPHEEAAYLIRQWYWNLEPAALSFWAPHLLPSSLRGYSFQRLERQMVTWLEAF